MKRAWLAAREVLIELDMLPDDEVSDMMMVHLWRAAVMS